MSSIFDPTPRLVKALARTRLNPYWDPKDLSSGMYDKPYMEGREAFAASRTGGWAPGSSTAGADLVALDAALARPEAKGSSMKAQAFAKGVAAAFFAKNPNSDDLRLGIEQIERSSLAPEVKSVAVQYLEQGIELLKAKGVDRAGRLSAGSTDESRGWRP